MHDDYTHERVLLKNRIRRRGIYLLPNLFTTAALFAGFYAIVQAMNLTFDRAAIAIFVAMLLHAAGRRVEQHCDPDGNRSAVERQVHRLHDRVEPGEERSRREKIRQKIDAPAADPVLLQRAFLCEVVVHGGRSVSARPERDNDAVCYGNSARIDSVASTISP